jgi:hypothetical protein
MVYMLATYIYAPMLFTATCVMLLMRVASFTRVSGRGLALEIETLLSPVKWHRADRGVPFGAQKVEISRPNPLPLAQVMGASSIKSITHRAV